MAMRLFCTTFVVRTGGGLLQYQTLTKTKLNAVWPLICRYKKPPCYFQVRNIMKDTNKTFLKPKHNTDRLSKEYEFIYGSTNTNYVNYGIPTIICLFIMIVPVMGKVLYDYHVKGIKPSGIQIGLLHSDSSILLAYIVLGFVLRTSLYLARIYNSMVLRIYYHASKDQYVGILYRPVGNSKLTFTAADVRYHEQEPKRFAGRFEIKGKNYIINLPGFVKVNHYNRLVGYDTGELRIEPPKGVFGQWKQTYEDLQKKKSMVEDLYNQKKKQLKK